MTEFKRQTVNQRGAIMGHFTRLGLAHPAHRVGRLAVISALLDLDRIASVNDLDRRPVDSSPSSPVCATAAPWLSVSPRPPCGALLTSSRRPNRITPG